MAHVEDIGRDFPDRSSRIRLPARVWYAAYGSNMHPERLACYLRGGRPSGGWRAQPGCRDPRPPERSVPVVLPGLLYFATESTVWGGGRAFYDPHATATYDSAAPPAAEGTPARAHLLTGGQFCDIAAQEMGREPRRDLDLSGVLRTGRARLGPGRYETLLCLGSIDGHPLLTFTAPRGWDSGHLPLNAPAAQYLRHLGAGLVAAHGWEVSRAAAYLATRPGARGVWTAEAVGEVLSGLPRQQGPLAPPQRAAVAPGSAEGPLPGRAGRQSTARI